MVILFASVVVLYTIEGIGTVSDSIIFACFCNILLSCQSDNFMTTPLVQDEISELQIHAIVQTCLICQNNPKVERRKILSQCRDALWT